VQDNEIWEYARKSDYLIVSKDSDFSEMSVVRGFPPKVIWIRSGNCSTQKIEELLRQYYDRIKKLYQSENEGILLLH
jgi:predicted nuclease of predicted toxin-antitoxin system